MDVGVVAELRRFPVKSMQGEQVASVRLGPLGIEGDRRLALRDVSTGKIVSAKVPRLGRPLLTCTARARADGDVEVQVGDATFGVVEDRTPLQAALSALLGVGVEISSAGDIDEVYASEWPELPGMALSGIDVDLPVLRGTFADLAPLHLLTTSSIAHLATLVPGIEITAQRFRPGILIETGSGTDAAVFVENEWEGRTARIGQAVVRLGAASPRCIMTTLEQPGLDRAPGVLQALAAHNRRDFGGFGDFACLGVYAEVLEPGEVAVGSAMTILD